MTPCAFGIGTHSSRATVAQARGSSGRMSRRRFSARQSSGKLLSIHATAASARCKLKRAIQFVYALSFTEWWYSSGPTTSRIWKWRGPRVARLVQKRAVSTRILDANLAQKIAVAHGLPISPHGECHRRRHVQLLASGENGNELAGGLQLDRAWRDVVTGHRRFPREARTVTPELSRSATRAIEGVVAVPEQVPSDVRRGVQVERELEDLDIPEDVPFIGAAGQRASGNRDPRISIGGADEMIRAEAERLLGSRAAGDAQVRTLPDGAPALDVCRQQISEVGPAHPLDMANRLRQRLANLVAGVDGDIAAQGQCLAEPGGHPPAQSFSRRAVQHDAGGDA